MFARQVTSQGLSLLDNIREAILQLRKKVTATVLAMDGGKRVTDHRQSSSVWGYFLASSGGSRHQEFPHTLIADLEDLERLEASEIAPRRTNVKEILISQKDDESIFTFANGTAKLSGRDYEFRESTLRREPTVRSEDFSRELQDEPGESQPTETTGCAEARADFWSIQGDFIYRHHNEPRVQPEGRNIPFSTEIY